MSFAVAFDRVHSEFLEMPGMELTFQQAIRLWNLGADDCRIVLDALVDAGFLRWTANRTVIRTGCDLRVTALDYQHIPVTPDPGSHKNVGHD